MKKLFVCVSALLTLTIAGQVMAQKLSPEGEQRKSAHEFLFGEFAEGKELEIQGTEPNQILNEIIVSTERRELKDDVTVELPAGSSRVIGKFRYLVLRGRGLENLEGLKVVPYSPDGDLSISIQKTNIYRVKVPSMPPPSKDMPPFTIKTKCKPDTTAVITEIAFNSQNKLPVVFDDIPYRNLGTEFPSEKVVVEIDLNRELSVGGHVDLEREKFCRYYATPGNLHPSFENWAAERNFLPGRQIFKLEPGLVKGYSPNQPKLTESKTIKGAADLSFFDRYNAAAPSTIDAFQDVKYAMCLNDYPDFMSIEQVGRGTPLVEHFDKAADLAATYIEAQRKAGGRTAAWWEVKNESTIKAEWDYHYREGIDSWKLMADLHNQVADAVHKKTPGIQVGGPSSAWMQVQVQNFGLYRNQTKFMDLTKDHLDFYSHHFYEDIGSLGAWERREGTYTNYLLGRMEAVLDMFAAHMHETDNVKPILITECGSLQSGRAASDYWLRIRSFSAYMHKLMRRPDQVDLAVPFVFLQMPWNPNSGNVAFIPKDGKPTNCPLQDCDPTPVRYFFELWKDFDGRRLPVTQSRDFLDVTAVHNGNQLQVAITNMGGRLLDLDFSSIADRIVSAHQRRLTYLDGEIDFENALPLSDLTAIPINVGETTLVLLELNEPLKIESVLEQERLYAAGTAVKHWEQSQPFEIKIDSSALPQEAKLLVGVQRRGGLQDSLRGTFNGEPFEIKETWASEMNNLFASLSLKVPTEWIQDSNQIAIEPQQGLTITSVQLETRREKR